MERSAHAPMGPRLIFLFSWFFHRMKTSANLPHPRVNFFFQKIMAGPGTFEYLEKLMAVES